MPKSTIRRRVAVPALALLAGSFSVALTGCGGPAAEPGATPTPSISMMAPTPSPSSSQSSSQSTGTPSKPSNTPTVAQPSKDQVTIKITIAGGQVDPNGRKIDVAQGSTVVLEVTSDADDEIHAHTGGDGYELEVKAGQPATGRFVLSEPGSFEVESHHLEKTIVILNVR